MTTASASQPRPNARLRRVVASLSRLLHLYISMVSCAIVLFFAATGVTLNHQNWFSGQQKTVVRHGHAPAQMLGNKAAQGDAAKVDTLGLVEMLRAQGIHGAMSDLRVEDSQIAISFTSPGYSADAFIARDSGNYDVTETRSGFVAILNDLHKGRDSGKAWSVFIDVSAGLLVLVSVTGLVLLWFIHKRRVAGFVLLASGALVCLALYVFFVP